MPQVQRSIVIQAPPEAVWKAVTDPALAPQWNDNVLEVCDIERGPDGCPIGWTQTISAMGRRITQEAQVTVSEPPYRGQVTMTGPGSPRITTTIEAVYEGSRLTQTMDFTIPGGPLGKIAQLAAVPAVERELDVSLHRQKEAIEAGVVKAAGT